MLIISSRAYRLSSVSAACQLTVGQPSGDRRQTVGSDSTVTSDEFFLPARLLNSGDQAFGSHLAELNTAEAEDAHVSFRTSGHFATVVQTNGRSVFREGLEPYIVTILEELRTFSSVFSNEFSALYLAGFH